MQRHDCLSAAAAYFDDGRFLADLRRRIAFRTESDTGVATPALGAYLREEIGPPLAQLGFDCELIDNPVSSMRRAIRKGPPPGTGLSISSQSNPSCASGGPISSRR